MATSRVRSADDALYRFPVDYHLMVMIMALWPIWRALYTDVSIDATMPCPRR